MAYQVTAGRFIGRTQELALGGEAGVGKTRLVEQLTATAGEQGVRVPWGGCVPLGEEGVPFAPVIEALHGLVGDLDPAELAVVVGPVRADLGRLLPDLDGGTEAARAPAAASHRTRHQRATRRGCAPCPRPGPVTEGKAKQPIQGPLSPIRRGLTSVAASSAVPPRSANSAHRHRSDQRASVRATPWLATW
jgi:hypothetical protein